jgi:hypothetical protein
MALKRQILNRCQKSAMPKNLEPMSPTLIPERLMKNISTILYYQANRARNGVGFVTGLCIVKAHGPEIKVQTKEVSLLLSYQSKVN